MFGQKKRLVMCQNCRALVDPAASVCPMCGNEAVPEQRVSGSGTSGNFFAMLILGINVLIFILMGAVGLKNGRGMEAFVASASGAVLVDFGSFVVVLVNEGQWWRFVTANFLHIGLIHLLFNSYALYQIGPLAENIFGEQKFIFIYVLTGIVSSIASYFFNINGAGASGAISGLIGLLAVYGYRQGGTFGKGLMRTMLTWIAMTIIYGFIIKANNVAHAAGFIAGGALGFWIKGESPETVRSATVWNALAVLSVVTIIASFVMVGINYGTVQQQAQQGPDAERQAQTVIHLTKAINNAEIALENSRRISEPTNLAEVARNLRRKAADVSAIAKLDERSDAIRNRVVDLMNKRAEALEKAAKNPKESTAFLPKDVDEMKATFDEYQQWLDSVLKKYGLVRTKEE
ncbi:MAG: rhomboid family intramembrane serine protease [Acidobacteria bacterium]|nr:rhomboid family intramembrane serine protease [Acidobacteriota bacterium]